MGSYRVEIQAEFEMGQEVEMGQELKRVHRKSRPWWR
jgi:hypothetical protein